MIFAKNQCPGEVLDLGLQLSVFGAGLGLDGPGCPKTPSNDKIVTLNNHTCLSILTPIIFICKAAIH